jgi:hypothetical protein
MKNMFIFAAVMEGRVLREVPPLMDQDFMYVADRHKREFDYPIHNHEVFELNFVANAAGVNRIVGDSSETIGSYDLVLITSPDLEHVWAQGDCCSEDIREITVQFFLDFTGDHNICNRTPMLSIQKMCMRARKGLAFARRHHAHLPHARQTIADEGRVSLPCRSCSPFFTSSRRLRERANWPPLLSQGRREQRQPSRAEGGRLY